MLAEIGIIVGLYIMTRMLSLERNKEGKVPTYARIFAAVTFLVTLFVTFDLVIRGLTTTVRVPGL